MKINSLNGGYVSTFHELLLDSIKGESLKMSIQFTFIAALYLCLPVWAQGVAPYATFSGQETVNDQYHVYWNAMGNGTVKVTTDVNTLTTLTADPNDNWHFVQWEGFSDVNNPLTLTLKEDLEITAVFCHELWDVNQLAHPVGFAAVEINEPNTTGGLGGEVIVVTTGEQLNTLMKSRKDSRFNKHYPPLIVVIEGVLTFPEDEMIDVKETYNLSILGKDPNATLMGVGLNIYKSYNIIVRNLTFMDCPDDAINVDDPLSHHIWIDHCTFTDSPDVDVEGERHDGLVDIKGGANYITVSWNRFENHRKTCLLGHSDNNGAEDIGRLKVSYHHNWFNNTHSRHPRVRFGQCHVFNNLYDNRKRGMDYAIASTEQADVLVEANMFWQVRYPSRVGYGNSDPGDLQEYDNLYINSGTPQTRGTTFDPCDYYDYTTDPAADIPWLIMTYAGAGVLDVAPLVSANPIQMGR